MKNKKKYAIAVGNYSYSFTTDPQLVPMTWVERYDTLAEACAEINDIYKYRSEDGCGGFPPLDYDLTIIEESEIDNDLARSICGDDYREDAPNHEQHKAAAAVPILLGIKIQDGYFCLQGGEAWTQKTAIGWAVTSKDAQWLEQVAAAHKLENYTLEEVS